MIGLDPQIGGFDGGIGQHGGGRAKSDVAAKIKHQRYGTDPRDQVDIMVDNQHLRAT